MSTTVPAKTTVRQFLEDRQRRRSRKGEPKQRHVYPSANVISMAEWSYARNCLNCDIANAEHKLAKANLQRVEDGIRREFSNLIDLIKKEVVGELKKKRTRKPKK